LVEAQDGPLSYRVFINMAIELCTNTIMPPVVELRTRRK